MHLFTPDSFLFPEPQRRGKEVGAWGRNLGPLVPPPVPCLHAQFNPQILLKSPFFRDAADSVPMDSSGKDGRRQYDVELGESPANQAFNANPS